MRRVFKIILILTVLLLFCFIISSKTISKVKAKGYISERQLWTEETDSDTGEDAFDGYINTLDFSEMQEILDENTDNSFEIKAYVEAVLTGKESISVNQFGNKIMNMIKEEIEQQKNVFFRLLTLAFVAGIFSNFSSLFKNNQVGETSFYIVYLIMFSVLIVSYFSAAQLTKETFERLIVFMKVLLPTYFAAMTFVTGITASMGFYEMTLMSISIAEIAVVKIALPIINVYFILSLANRISNEDMLSKFTETMEVVVKWGLKAILGIVVGMHTIQSMVLPAANQLKYTAINKTVSTLPVLGDILGSVTEAVVGGGMLVKNAIGAVGLISIIVICAVPLIKLVIYHFIYRMAMTAAQPISDKRMLGCMEGAVKSSELLIYTGCVGSVLFLFTIVVITAFTGTGIIS